MKIFMGYDSRESVAFDVAKYSAERWSDIKVTALRQDELRARDLYWRAPDPLSSTEFSFSRFLVPALMDYKGWALFVDCDVLFLESPADLFALADEQYAVMCVKHDYRPTNAIKMDGKVQHQYPRKNWSSVVLFNCGHPANRKLTPSLVNTESGQYLHRFEWLREDEIGSLPHEWNWLVGWYQEPRDGKPKLLHYTEGGPWFDNYKNCEYADEWIQINSSNLIEELTHGT